jgi:hypothetical protein
VEERRDLTQRTLRKSAEFAEKSRRLGDLKVAATGISDSKT